MMGIKLGRYLWVAPLFGALSSVQANEVTACIVDMDLPNNPVYYYLPTVASKLKCEIDRADYHPTLQELYQDGWRIAAVIDPKVKNRPGSPTERPSAVFYMERGGVNSTEAGVDGSGQKQEGSGFLKGIF